MEYTHCILSGYQFDDTVKFEPTLGTYLEYTFGPVGRVKIALATIIDFKSKNEYSHPVLAGICRNEFENGKEHSEWNFSTGNIQSPEERSSVGILKVKDIF